MAGTFNKYILKGITDEQVDEVMKNIRPIKWQDGEPYFLNLKKVHRHNTAFLWDPKFGDKVKGKLVEVTRFHSAHTFGAPSLFKPSLAECAAQLLPYLGQGNAFELATPDVNAGMLFHLMDDGRLLEKYDFSQIDRVAESLHRATIVLFRQEA